MSGVMSPVGPEEPRVYWVRRAIVAVVVLLLVIVVATAVNAINNENPQAPPPAESTGPSLRPAESATPTPAGGSPSASSSPPASSSPSSSSSGATAKPTPGATDSSESAKSKKSPKASASSTKPAKPAKPGPCAADDLAVKLTGPSSIALDKEATFKISVTNTGDATCKVVVTPDNFELRIFSGTDRIWTTEACPARVKTRGKELASGKALTWEQKWDVSRSKGCKKHPSDPRPGTYAANAELAGVAPSQVVMRLS